MKKLLFTLLFLTLGTAWGGALEDGGAAFERNDYVTAIKLWRPLAEQGNAPAQAMLGAMYNEGLGVTQDYKEAAKWFRLAAEQGVADAQHNLGWMYANGQGVLQDYKEAVRLYRLAAEQGYAKAQSNLGTMYRTGHGVLQDYVRAHMWYNLASAAGGSEYGTTNRDKVAKLMTPQQIEKAQEMAKACQASNFKGCLDEANKQWEADMGNEVAAYKAKIRAKILRNIVMSSDIPKDALAEFDVTLFSGGVVLNVKLVKSSGSAMYDRAVERAIKKSDPLPVPPEGLLSNQFRKLRLDFSPNE
jgi:TonB family protein